MKPILYLTLTLCLLFLIISTSAIAQEDEFSFVTLDSTKSAKINIYTYERTSDTARAKPVLLVHGFNSRGQLWQNPENDYVTELRRNGYDVIVVDMRGNKVDTDGDNKADEPVVGDSWGYGARDLGDDVGIALTNGIDYLNDNLPGRNYTKADVITHSTGALAVTSYSRSQGLITYKNNIGTIIELAPPNNGSTDLVANIKKTTQIIPSVFTQSMTAYEYCLEFIGDKVWIPGGRMESENLRKELMPESLFLQSIKGLGPDPSIETFVGIGDRDFIVGDWSPVIEGRDDIGYEYFIGLDHFKFCNSELVLKALLDKLEKGEESYFFNRFKPHRSKNMVTFLLGPGIGIDHPDDTFDVVTFAKGIEISPRSLFELYLRIAARKNKESLLNYWDALYVFDKAQKEIDQGASEETIVEKWSDALTEKNAVLHDSFSEASKEYLESPDIAILANGYYNELAKFIIEEVKEPVRVVDHTFNPSILNEQKVLVIPTGGLSGISQSDIFKKKLSAFVDNGGTLVCFSQQYGYDFHSLPTGEVKGYGWQEDALCYHKAAYIETFHQILSSQTELYPDIKLDGYFTDYPEESKVLLRRTKNLMPAMLMYNYGNGLVIIASIYTDWGNINGQAGMQEISLARDLIRWSKASSALQEYKIGMLFRKQIEVNRNFSKIEMILKAPDNSVLEKKISENPIFELRTPLEQYGIYCVDYILYDSESEIIQPQTEGFYFSFSRPPEGSVENPNFTFTITTDTENYINGTEATVTFHLGNNTRRDEVIKCKVDSTYGEIKFTESINVPARTTVTFDKQFIVTKTGWVFADFYSSGNAFLGHTERGINVVEPSVDVGMTTDRMQYAPGQKIQIRSNITNNSEIITDLFLVLNIVDSDNNQVYYNTNTLGLGSSEAASWDQDFDIPVDASMGVYKIRLSAFSNSRLVGGASLDIDIPGPLVFGDQNLPNSSEYLEISMNKYVYKPGESILAKIIIDSRGEIILDAILDVKVLPSIGTGSLWGAIMDDGGNPIRGAAIDGVYSDEEGGYILNNLRSGNLNLNIEASGYDKIEKDAQILSGDNNLDFTLAPSKYGDLYGAIDNAVGSSVMLEPREVSSSDACIRNAVVSSKDTFEFRHVPIGTYKLSIQPEGVTEIIQVGEGENVLDPILFFSTTLEQSSSSNNEEGSQIERVVRDELEPNNTFESADEISATVSMRGMIYDYGDEDYFKFQIDSASMLDISLTNVPDALSPHIIIHDAQGNWVNTTAALSGEDLSYSLEITIPGQYFLHLKDRYNSFSSEEKYVLEIDLEAGSDEYEPNHDFANAKKINIRQSVTCTIFPDADEDFFAFDIEKKGILYIEMLDVPEGLRPSIKIYDSLTSNVISQKGGSSGEKIDLETEIGEPRRYYLLVRDWYSNFSSFESYSFKAYFIDTLDEYEPNDTKEDAVPINFGQSYFATISTKGDFDFYKLSIPDAGRIIVSLTDVPSNIRPYIKLYTEGSDSWVDSTAGFAGEDLEMQFETDKPSNYFVHIQDRYNSEPSFLRYKLVVTYVPREQYIIENPVFFSQTIDIAEIDGKEEIEILIPGLEKNAKYYLQAALSSLNPPINSQVVEAFYVSDLEVPIEPTLVPELSIECLFDENTGFNVGEIANFIFRIKNTGGAGGGCKTDFRFTDLFSNSSYVFLEPGEEKEIDFEFLLPLDLEEGVYEAEYVFNGEKYNVDFLIHGVKIKVDAEYLGNPFRIMVQNIGAVDNVTLSAEVRCGSFEARKEILLIDSEELIFNIPDVSGQEKIYYGIYFSSGKALYLNSVLIDGEEEPGILLKVIEASCDKNSYTDGESVTINWKIQSEDIYLLRLVVDLIGPDSGATEIIDEDVYLSGGMNDVERIASPGLREAGLYRIFYRFYRDDLAVLQGSLFFDVGEEIAIELRLGEKSYTKDRSVKFKACCFSSAESRGELRLFLDGESVSFRRVRLDGYREFDLDVRRVKQGQHEAHCILYCDGRIITSNTINFTIAEDKNRRCFRIHRGFFRLLHKRMKPKKKNPRWHSSPFD